MNPIIFNACFGEYILTKGKSKEWQMKQNKQPQILTAQKFKNFFSLTINFFLTLMFSFSTLHITFVPLTIKCKLWSQLHKCIHLSKDRSILTGYSSPLLLELNEGIYLCTDSSRNIIFSFRKKSTLSTVSQICCFFCSKIGDIYLTAAVIVTVPLAIWVFGISDIMAPAQNSWMAL